MNSERLGWFYPAIFTAIAVCLIATLNWTSTAHAEAENSLGDDANNSGYAQDKDDGGGDETVISDEDEDEEQGGDEEIDVGEIEVEGEKAEDAEALPGEDYIFIDLDGLAGGLAGIGSALDLFGGIDVRSVGSGFDLTTISIRGAAPHRLMLYLEGVPLSPSVTGVFDLSLFPAEAIGKAAVARGPAAIGQGLAGEVDFSLARPDETYARTSYGSFGTVSVSGGAPFAFAGGDGTVFAAHRRTDGDFSYMRHDGRTYTRDNNARDHTAVLFGFERGGDRVRDRMIFFAADRSGGVPGISEFPSPDAHQDDTLILAGMTRDVKDVKGGDLAISFYTRFSHTGFGDPDPYLGDAVNTDQSEYAAGAFARFRAPAGSDIAGAKIAIDGVMLKDSAYGNPERLTGTLSFWREFYRGDFKFSIAAGGEYGSGGNFGWRGKAAGTFELGSGWTLSGSAARMFRRPNFSELYYPESGFIGGNSELKDETGYAFDFGPHFKCGRFSLDLVGFCHRYAESVQFIPVTQYRIRAENTGAIRSEGLSADATYDLGRGVNIFGSYTRLDAKYLDGGLPLAGRAPSKLAVGIERKDARVGWRITYLHTSETPVDRFGNLKVAASTDLSAGLSIETSGGWRISIAGMNLLDDDLRDHLNFPRPGRAFEVSIGYRW